MNSKKGTLLIQSVFLFIEFIFWNFKINLFL